MKRLVLAAVGILASWGIAVPSARPGERRFPAAPPAPIHTVDTNYFGTVIHDPYRWMEDSSPEFQAWVTAQAEHTRAILDRLPWHDAFVKRVNELVSPRTEIASVRAVGDHLYYLKRLPGEDRFKLFVRDNIAAPERLVLDPGQLSHRSIDYYAPSPDGRYVAYGLSENGSEQSVLGILDVASGRPLADRIDRARGADPYWLPDGRSFFYTRQRALSPGAAPSDAYLKMRTHVHVLGRNPEQDPPVFGYAVSALVPFAPTDMPLVMVIAGSPYVLGVVTHGTNMNRTVYYAPLERVGTQTPWKKLVDVDDQVTDLTLHGKDVYILSSKGAPRAKVIRTSLDKIDLAHADTVVPPGPTVVRDLFAAADGVYVRVLDGGIGRVLRIPFAGGPVERIPLPFDGAIGELISTPTVPGVLFESQTWVRMPAVYRYDPDTRKVNDSGLLPPSQIDTSPYVSIEVQASGADGQAVPLSIVHRRGIALDRARPTWLSGYGSYGVSFDPNFSPRRLAWLDRGGIYAIAHVRGGGEYGEEWHDAGMKKNKKNGVDDFIACAQYLVEHGYTSPQHLGAEGTSAGGIIVGGAITRRPDLFSAALIRVGVSDLLRFEETPGGPGNTVEFGSAKVADDFPALLAASPYQQVKNGLRYPAVMLTASAHDARVPLWEPAKMTARLQAATASGRPILLRVAYEAGHGAGLGTATSEVNAELSDCYTFFYWQLSAHAGRP